MRGMLYLLISLSVISCFEQDEPVMPYPGDIVTISDSVQVYQTWFDLESGTAVGVNPLNSWTLAFESADSGWRILVNSGADWFIYNSGETGFPAEISLPASPEGLFDDYKLWPDSTAVGNWPAGRNTYLLLKYEKGSLKVQNQVKFIEFTDTTYSFLINTNGNTDTVIIRKDESAGFSYYSASQNQQIYPEPEKEEYDLIFTSYFDRPTLFGQTMPYKVGGVLLNAWQTAAVLDTITPYEQIGSDLIPLLDFSQQRDIPGYNWKDVSVDITGGGSASYTVKQGYNYIILTAQGNYFRLRFLSYTLDGRSGFPRFEYSRL